jgi:hypothetical protein
MFERYTEKARRVIFFARYEASQFGSPYIETEHLLLGLLREDKALASRFLRSHEAIESIRNQIEASATVRVKIHTSVDLPLSHECKRALAFAAEESERLNHSHIGPSHLFLGLLREEGTFAAQILQERGLRLAEVRQEIALSSPEVKERPGAVQVRVKPPSVFVEMVMAWEVAANVTVATLPSVGIHSPDFAIYDGRGVDVDGQPLHEAGFPSTPAEEIAFVQRRIQTITKLMESAIAIHEFQKARFYADEERKEREQLRQLREKYKFTEPVAESAVQQPGPIPFLCIEFLPRGERFQDMRQRFEDYLAAGVAQVWALDISTKKAYEVTTAEGFRECKGPLLRPVHTPALALDLAVLFA